MDITDRFVDAMTRTTELVGYDRDYAQSCSRIYSENADLLAQLVHGTEQPDLAFLAIVLDGNTPRMAFGALMPDRLLLVWEYGIVSSKHGSTVIPYRAIRNIQFETASADPRHGGNPILRLNTGIEDCRFLIPPKGAAVAAAIRDRVSAAVSAPDGLLVLASATEPTTAGADERAVSDPETPASTLAEIANRRPDLGSWLAAHPQAYPELLQWLANYGDGAARATASARLAGTPAPTTPTQPATPHDIDHAAVMNPSTDPAVLAAIAARRPDLGAAIAAHPNAYDGLREWLAARQAAALQSSAPRAAGSV